MNAVSAAMGRQAAAPRVVEISDLAHDGRGVVRGAGKVLFIPDALPGEQVKVLARRAGRQFEEGQLLEILRPSPERVTPRCRHFGVCGGCALQHCQAAAQLAHKQAHLLENLKRIGRVEPESLLPLLQGPLWGYRRRARLGVKYVPRKDRVLVGFRERASPYLADIHRCEVLHPQVGYKLEQLAALIGHLSVREQIPQIEVAVADNAVALVLRSLAPLPEADRAQLRAFSVNQGVWFYLQSGGPDRIQPLAPDTPELYYDLPQHAARIYFEPCDFIQVNAAVNADLINCVLELLRIEPQETVLELFSGLGNFSLPMARRAARVIAVEGATGLVARARQNGRRNAIDNVEFHTADLFAPTEAAWLRQPFDKLLLDPPRAGAQEILPVLAAKRPARIVYVSCHPGTLARDAGLLVGRHGYRLTAAGVIDMFPHTHHVESIALFEHG